MQDIDVEIDLKHDSNCVYLAVEIPKEADEAFVSEVLWMVSEAFAETESVSEVWMHDVLETIVRGFESDSHLKFIWERCFEKNDPDYPERLRRNLTQPPPSPGVN
jgi:hypothetical protein